MKNWKTVQEEKRKTFIISSIKRFIVLRVGTVHIDGRIRSVMIALSQHSDASHIIKHKKGNTSHRTTSTQFNQEECITRKKVT